MSGAHRTGGRFPTEERNSKDDHERGQHVVVDFGHRRHRASHIAEHSDETQYCGADSVPADPFLLARSLQPCHRCQQEEGADRQAAAEDEPARQPAAQPLGEARVRALAQRVGLEAPVQQQPARVPGQQQPQPETINPDEGAPDLLEGVEDLDMDMIESATAAHVPPLLSTAAAQVDLGDDGTDMDVDTD